MAVPAVTVAPAVMAVRAVLRVPGGWLLMVVPVVLVAMRGPRAMVPPVPRVWLGRRGRAMVATVVTVVLAVTVVTAVQAVLAGLPRVVVTRALRALLAWRPTAASVVLVLLAVPGSTPQV